jgi:hypothetical protein
LHNHGRSSDDDIFEFFHKEHYDLTPYLIISLSNLTHRGNNHDPDVVESIEGGRRMYREVER